ncbi:uncharacterized protein LOC123315387 [Coccinella septempunctata]|uniref:uncharacterized protein LOC123315387 n=1 Tax=Coccinella septempunctata TaxID=41139 RepID=UPI001D07174A|nr:uncharacterized protein LOC123315387 [Coccinella septempunctata]
MSVKFVQLIENRPCLYNNTLQEYSRKDVTEKAWAEIARSMEWTVADCKEKWKNIRNGFVRSLKPLPLGSTSKTKKLYYLHDAMQFVLPYVRPIQQSQNTSNPVTTEISNESTLQFDEDDCEHTTNDSTTNTEQHNDETSQTQAKRKLETSTTLDKKVERKKVKKEKDDADTAIREYLRDKRESKTRLDDKQMFLLSLLPDVSKLSDKNLRQFKIRTMILLEDMLTHQEQIGFSHTQGSKDPLTWSGSTSNASSPGASPSSSVASPQYSLKQLSYEHS